MRGELESAYRSLGLFQRFRFRAHLQDIASMIDPTQTIEAVGFGWWRGRRSITVVTGTHLLLARCSGGQAQPARSVIFWRSVSRVCVHSIPPHGARFRVLVGSYLEEFTVHTHTEQVDAGLRAAVAPAALTAHDDHPITAPTPRFAPGHPRTPQTPADPIP